MAAFRSNSYVMSDVALCNKYFFNRSHVIC
jgi:hypothetical protein